MVTLVTGFNPKVVTEDRDDVARIYTENGSAQGELPIDWKLIGISCNYWFIVVP